MSDDDLELRFLGPLISVRRVEDHLPLYANVFGLQVRCVQQLDEAEVEAIWGVRGRGAGLVLLETGETRTGVLLVQFDPASNVVIRGGSRTDHGAAKLVELVTRNFEVATNFLENAGYSYRAVARYSIPPQGRFTEGQVDTADGVICSVLRMHDTSMDDLVRVHHRLFGEILSVTTPVVDLAQARRFYELLDLEEVFRYSVESESLGTLVGGDEETGLHGINFATAGVRAPMIALVRYSPGAVGDSLAERAVLPNRGIVALRFMAPSVERIATRLISDAGRDLGLRVVIRGRGLLEPFGAVDSLLVQAPHGVLHHFVSRL